MTTGTKELPDIVSYERDFHAWCLEQAARLRERARPGDNDGLDYANLAEEIESMGRSDRRSIKSHLRVLLCHLLKWRHQPSRRSRNWEDSIFNARTAIADLLTDSPSLEGFAREIVTDTYLLAVRDAASQTRGSKATFPQACPFSADQIFDLDFLPEEGRIP